ncbi:hypothetical protein HY025_05315 [Candidatus Daviesbacteria bacterium]|nr:hypothetical protein [Candidatus Daviesbacteria bacterium]
MAETVENSIDTTPTQEIAPAKVSLRTKITGAAKTARQTLIDLAKRSQKPSQVDRKNPDAVKRAKIKAASMALAAVLNTGAEVGPDVAQVAQDLLNTKPPQVSTEDLPSEKAARDILVDTRSSASASNPPEEASNQIITSSNTKTSIT